jgi:hypothetical protein
MRKRVLFNLTTGFSVPDRDGHGLHDLVNAAPLKALPGCPGSPIPDKGRDKLPQSDTLKPLEGLDMEPYIPPIVIDTTGGQGFPLYQPD